VSAALAAVLADEAEIYEALIAVFDEQAAALHSGDRQAVAGCAARQAPLLDRLLTAELQRRALVAALSGSPDTLLRALPSPASGLLREARARLRAVLPRVREAIRRLEPSLAEGLGQLRRLVALLQEVGSLETSYTPAAQMVRVTPPTLDRRA